MNRDLVAMNIINNIKISNNHFNLKDKVKDISMKDKIVISQIIIIKIIRRNQNPYLIINTELKIKEIIRIT
jgi:hypothetical protein